MTSRSLRRLAADHASLRTSALPPNYLFQPGKDDDAFADLTTLSVLLAGPQGTPFTSGLYTLDLSIPTTYPAAAPTAHFRTKIFHPNIDPASGAVCVETLKRDWKPELTLRDILVTISCLLIYPNPASALNAEAGRLVEVDFAEYERKARLWARMHAAIPATLQAAVEEARNRGEDVDGAETQTQTQRPVRKRYTVKRERKTTSEDVFVREDTVHTTPPKRSMPPPAMRGLGIDLPGASLNAALETSTLLTVSSRAARKKAGTGAAHASSSRLHPPLVETTAQRPLIHSNPSTPRLHQPATKRPRLTPPLDLGDGDTMGPSPGSPHSERRAGAAAERDMPWLTWQPRSPPLPHDPRSEARRRRLERLEEELLQSVGGCLKTYNRGRFGPRIGMGRL